MVAEISVVWSWVLLGVLTSTLCGLAFAGWWLLRRRRRYAMRAEVADELRASVRRIGIGTVWQAPLFQADVFGLRGSVDRFELRAELWDKAGHDFVRVSVYFPQTTGQGLRVRMKSRKSVSDLMRIEEVELRDLEFDGMFRVLTRPNKGDEIAAIFHPELRRRLVSIGGRVDDLKLGDRSLYLLVDGGVEPSMVAPLVEDSLEVARIFYERSLQVRPATAARNTEYEMAAEDVLGRGQRGSVTTEALPAGTQKLDALELSDGDEREDTEKTDELDVYRRLSSSGELGLSDSETSELSEGGAGSPSEAGEE